MQPVAAQGEVFQPVPTAYLKIKRIEIVASSVAFAHEGFASIFRTSETHFHFVAITKLIAQPVLVTTPHITAVGIALALIQGHFHHAHQLVLSIFSNLAQRGETPCLHLTDIDKARQQLALSPRHAVYHGKLTQALHRPIAIDVSLDVLYLLGGEKRQALKVFRSGGIDVDGVFCQLVQHVLIFLPRLVLKVLHIAQLIQILLPRCRSSYLLLSQDHDRHQTYEQKPNCPLRHLFGLLG